jgi:hypothetical protein
MESDLKIGSLILVMTHETEISWTFYLRDIYLKRVSKKLVGLNALYYKPLINQSRDIWILSNNAFRDEVWETRRNYESILLKQNLSKQKETFFRNPMGPIRSEWTVQQYTDWGCGLFEPMLYLQKKLIMQKCGFWCDILGFHGGQDKIRSCFNCCDHEFLQHCYVIVHSA